MSTEHELEEEIRRVLESRAEEIEVPEDLAERTMARAEAERPSLRERVRARRDARRADGGRVTGYPRWAYAGAAAALLVAFGAVGQLTLTPAVMERARDPVATVDEARGGAGLSVSPLSSEGGVPSGERSAIVQGGSGGGAEPDVAAPEPDFIEPPFPQPPGDFPPQLVRSADVQVEVGEGRFEEARRRAQEITQAQGGAVTGFSTSEAPTDGNARGTLTLRIPAEKLEAALGELRDLGTLVSMDTSGFDVSGQLADLEARIRNAQAQEARLLELMDEAEDLSQTLEIRARLDDVRREIEGLQAREESLETQVAFSTVRLTLFEPGEGPSRVVPDGRIGEAFDTGVRLAVTVLAGMLVVGIALAPIAALGALFWAGVRVVRARRVE